MSEFKYACPVCGQHIKCDSSQAGTVMDCPTCFQKITVPQAPASDDQKFILTGTQVTGKRITAQGLATASAKRDSDGNLLKTVVFVVALALAGAAAFAFRGKLFNFGSAWQAGDIGEVGAAGSFSQANGGFTVNGSGADTWHRADGFYYVFQPLNGDGALTAHVLNIKNTDVWAKAGVMIRETTEASSMFAEATIRPDGQAQFVWRNATGGEAASSQLAGGMGYPKWVKLVRSGNRFSAFYRVKAVDEWQPIGEVQTISMTPTSQIGLVVCAHNYGTLCQAQFDQVTLQAGDHHDKKAASATTPPAPPVGGGADARSLSVNDLALNKPAMASSQEAKNPVQNGNDGNDGTRWCASGGSIPQWWEVDLGSPVVITNIQIVWEKESAYRYVVQTSLDHTHWTNRVDKTANATPARTNSDDFSAHGRYVRIVITGLTPGIWASFYEFKAFGSSNDVTNETHAQDHSTNQP